MKQIIIFILLIIVAIMGFNFYQEYHRFSPPNYEYQGSETIDPNHPNKALLLDYYQAIEAVNGFVITQWSAHKIDVRNPEDDDGQTLSAVSEYTQKLGRVKFYESQLKLSAKETPKRTSSISEIEKRNTLIRKMYYQDGGPNAMKLGDRNALVFEIQRLLIAQGDSILHDGVYRDETFNAMQSFEAKNGLFVDGKLDAITLELLLDQDL